MGGSPLGLWARRHPKNDEKKDFELLGRGMGMLTGSSCPPTATEAGEGAAEAAGAGAAPALRGADAAGGGAAARGARAGTGLGARLPLPLSRDLPGNTRFLPLESKLLNC